MVEKRFSVWRLIISVLLVLICLTMLIPMLNILAKSFSEPSKVPLMKGYQIWPKGFSLMNYNIIFSNNVIFTAFKNSIFITIVGVAINILLTSSAAYVLTRPGLMGKKVLMTFLIIMMIVKPGIIQEYFVIKDIKLLNSLWAMVFYRSVSVYYLILLMRFFSSMPPSFLEAAEIDGAGHMNLLFRVFLPLNTVPILTISMFYTVYRWNEFFHSSIFLSSRSKTVIQVFLRQFIVDGDTTALAVLGSIDLTTISVKALQAATIMVVIAPILMLYPLMLKYYTGGVLTGGVKE